MEYYIAESGEILGVMGDLPFGERSAKHILFHIFKQIVNYKKQDSTKGEGAFNPAPAEGEGEYYGDDGYGGTATFIPGLSRVPTTSLMTFPTALVSPLLSAS